ncbi:MAG: phenylacetate--CoA ligase family protein [Alphaproteobacteria bacterium]|nr:MAG: phenylacetate--CoA ligase family protein [Alphaproteobacteria bacterium]
MVVKNLIASIYSQKMGRKKFGMRFEAHLADLRRRQWYSQEDILRIQSEKIRRTVGLARDYVPYYRELFSKLGIREDSIRSADDLKQLPILEKPVFQRLGEQFRSELFKGSSDIQRVHTSGSTGTALSIDVDLDYLKLEKAYLWLQREWCGVHLGDRSAQFSGMPVVPVKQRKPPFWIHDRSENRTIFSVRHMSSENLTAYGKALAELDPQLIVGYPMAIYLMARHLIESGNHRVRPRGIFTASETLHPYQREVMKAAFGCPVLDLYGQMEYSGMLIQCDQGSYHVQEDYGVVEILKPDGSLAVEGEKGEIVATGLNNSAMPLLRYRTGDLAIPKDGSCSCGRCGRLVERVLGRSDDVIVTADGRMLNRVSSIFMEMTNILEAQLVQESLENLLVRVVPRSADFNEKDRSLLVQKVREHTGLGLEIQIQVLERIPRRPSGKFQFVISHLPSGAAVSKGYGTHDKDQFS